MEASVPHWVSRSRIPGMGSGSRLPPDQHGQLHHRAQPADDFLVAEIAVRHEQRVRLLLQQVFRAQRPADRIIEDAFGQHALQIAQCNRVGRNLPALVQEEVFLLQCGNHVRESALDGNDTDLDEFFPLSSPSVSFILNVLLQILF